MADDSSGDPENGENEEFSQSPLSVTVHEATRKQETRLGQVGKRFEGVLNNVRFWASLAPQLIQYFGVLLLLFIVHQLFIWFDRNPEAAFEQAAFDALSADRDDPSGAGEPQAKGRDEPLEQYEGWDERVAGQVTAEYDLDGRKALNLSIPGYRCRGGGVVLLSIVVSPRGDVLEASVVSAATEGGEAMSSCLETESLRSVRQCRFQSKADAPRRLTGTLTYRFIAQ